MMSWDAETWYSYTIPLYLSLPVPFSGFTLNISLLLPWVSNKYQLLNHVWHFTRLLCPWDFPGNSTGVDWHFLLQGIFPTQGSNPGLPHCRQMLYRLSHQGSPYIYNWSIVDLQCFRCTARWLSYTNTYIYFQIIFHHRLLQDSDYSSLCYAVNLCCLLHIYI